MPRVQDSAFPPFNTEHRYRGVYERAGFDVNKNLQSPRLPATSSANSIRSRTTQRSAPMPFDPREKPPKPRNRSQADLPSHHPQYPPYPPVPYPEPVPQSAVSEPLMYRELDHTQPAVAVRQGGAPEPDSFNFVSTDNHGKKNYMNLSLDLKKSDDYYSDATVDNDHSNKANSDGTMDTSVKSANSSIKTDMLLESPEKRQLDNTLVRKQRLSTALDTFKQDVHDHKIANAPQSPQEFDPSQEFNPSQEFEQFKQHQNSQSDMLNTDYNQFLSSKNDQPRLSQMSMVSSILSKNDGNLDDEDDDPDEDSEVEKELERQLESLKVGGSSELLARTQPYPKQFPEDIESPEVSASPRMPVVPTFNIQETEPSTPDPQALQEEFNVNSPASLESIQPLSVNSKAKSIQLPDISKTPKVEHPRDPIESPEQLDQSTPAEVRMDRKPIPAFKYPSGNGPCRTCDRRIAPDARGSQRAIYSKTGELTGQWHRGCFTCSHQHCSVQFNKYVQCLVLDDEPYCEKHYHELNNSICQTCHLGIEGECIENELEQKWHLRCLTCTKCRRNIDTDYYLINDNIICEADALNIISGQESFNDAHGVVKKGGLSTSDKIEKRRTRLMHLDM